MKTIVVKTQAEIDALPEKFDAYTVIEIRSSGLVVLRREIPNGQFRLMGSSRAELRESSSAVLRGSSSAVLWESSSAVLRESSSAELRESSSAVLWESSRAELRESSSAVLWGSSSAVLWGSSSCHVRDRGVKIDDAWDQALIVFEDGLKPSKILKHGKDVQIIKRKPQPELNFTKKQFLERFKKNVEGDSIILFKSVNPNTLCDFYTGKIKYEGIVECPDWDPNPEKECGQGLHLSPTKGHALSYNSGKLLKCRVKIEDFVVYGPNITKVRCRRVEVLGAS